MSIYRIEWTCCGSVTETEAWEPADCPFCHDGRTPTEKAAPDLLQALQSIIEDMESDFGTDYDYNKARAAISKALGETS